MRDDLLLDALADRMFEEVNRNADSDEQAKARAMGHVFALAAREFRSDSPSPLAQAVLTQARQGAHLIEIEETDR
jgi:hypothetical protein